MFGHAVPGLRICTYVTNVERSPLGNLKLWKEIDIDNSGASA